MSTEPELVACAKCGVERPDFVIGTVQDRCPNCVGLKKAVATKSL